ncbi:MAG: hypothetical protein LC778_04765 [Acidobacteria bacterium]|nr:hypothetical protein [Acidobacteriota bacterium]
MSTATESSAATAGLRGVVAAQSSIGDVNGEQGVLIYQGYDIHDLAEKSTFEETVFLLWNGRLPKRDELEDLKKQFQANYDAPAEVLEMMKHLPKDANPMDILRTTVSALGFYDKEGHGTDRELAGPLHGGANTNVMKTLLEIGSPDKIESWLDETLAAKRKVMGIGHAVYKTEDPRATWLRKFSKQMSEKKGEAKWFEMSQKIERLMLERKGMYPNVDFYSASTYYLMNIPLDQYTPIFAVSRISGWTGHILEQYGNNKLIRPRAEYIGERDLKYTAIDER